jgi:ATP-dependent Zn protease
MVNSSTPLYKLTIKLSQNHRYISTCYHEAGHAVCGLLMFMKIPDVSVFKNRRITGETNYEQILDEKSQSSLFREYQIKSDIFIHYAGLMAEKIFYQDLTGSKIFPNVLKDGVTPDIQEAAQIIKVNNLAPAGRKRYLYKKKMMKEVRTLLEEHWDVVKVVAHALFEKRRLTHSDLKKIICRKTSNKKFWKKQFSYINEFVDKTKLLDNKDLKIIIPSIG